MFQLGISQLTSSVYHPESQGTLVKIPPALKVYNESKLLKDWDETTPSCYMWREKCTSI